MEKTKNYQGNQNSGSMLNLKTNEVYTQQPDHNNLNSNNHNQNSDGKNTEKEQPEFLTMKTTVTKNENQEGVKTYTCSMHPEVMSDKPGKCPKCGMELIEKK